jgi:hypothetical protein
MGLAEEWRGVKYAETFEAELRGLERRRAGDPLCKVTDIEDTLKHLYIMDGSDQGGRGGVQDVAMAATIAAYEHFISCWQAETARNK